MSFIIGKAYSLRWKIKTDDALIIQYHERLCWDMETMLGITLCND